MAEVFQYSRGGSHVIKIHRSMQLINQEQRCIQSLQRQLLFSKRVAILSKDFYATIQDDSIQLCSEIDAASQCQENMHSIHLDAEASITVITKFLSEIGLEKVTSSPLISHVA